MARHEGDGILVRIAGWVLTVKQYALSTREELIDAVLAGLPECPPDFAGIFADVVLRAGEKGRSAARECFDRHPEPTDEQLIDAVREAIDYPELVDVIINDMFDQKDAERREERAKRRTMQKTYEAWRSVIFRAFDTLRAEGRVGGTPEETVAKITQMLPHVSPEAIRRALKEWPTR